MLRGPGPGAGRWGGGVGPGLLSRPGVVPGAELCVRRWPALPESGSRGECATRQRAAGPRIECPAIREQCAGIIEHHDAVTKQAPPLLRTTDRDVCGHAIRRKCVCAPGLVFTHDDLPLTCLHITPTIADGRGAVDRGDPKPLFRLARIRNWSQQQPRTEAGPDESGQVPGDPFLNALAGRGLYVSRPGDNTEWNMLRPWSQRAGRQWSAPTG